MSWNLRIKTILTFAFIIAYSLPLNATIHYVSHNGSNTPPYLTWETAADSIQSAINVCAPGDTVIAANGVYYESIIIDLQIYLLGSSMDSTIIDGFGLEDFTIDFQSAGILQNFYVKGKGLGIFNTFCIWVDTYVNVGIINCKISNAYFGIGIVGSSCSVENVIINNVVRGYDAGCIFNDCQNFLRNCVIIVSNSNSKAAMLAGGGDYIVDNNIMLFTGSFSVEPGISTGFPRKVFIRNNLINGFQYRSIKFDTVLDTAFVKYNVITNGGSLSSAGNRVNVNNNIFLNNSRGIYQVGSGFMSSDYNLFWQNGLDLDGIAYGDSDIVADPMFVKDTLPNPQLDFDYHLQAFSPGIDKGDPNILDVDGTRSDIGMFGGPYGETYTYQNLAPRAPVNISAVVDSGNVTLKWNKNSEADTAYYNVYRDTTENFIISPAKLVGSPTDTFFTETIPQQLESVYYKITAVDNEGNESGPSEEVKIVITSVDEYIPIVKDYYLYQNYPNPFNPTTKIGYKLKERSYVKLIIYDIKGELVQVLINKEQEAGYYDVEFTGKNLSSGIYLYRIEVIGEGKIPKFSDMKKMILIK